MDNTITLKELINLKESNKFLDMKEELLGRTVTELQNSCYDGNVIIVDIDKDNITLMTTNSIGYGAWIDRSKAIDNFSNGFSSNIKSKIKSCFIPSYNQLDGGWSYMNSVNRRSLGFWYWTDTLYPDDTSYAWVVYGSGNFDFNYVNNFYDYVAGFTV